MEEANTKLAAALVQGKLNANPFVQGLLIQCMRRLERRESGKSDRGRWMDTTETEDRLVKDAALTLAMHGGNKKLCSSLSQCRAPHISLDNLIEHSLPNPALALMNKTRLESNLNLIDLKLPRKGDWPQRRLVCAIDATYLLKSYAQVTLDGKEGLVGGPWAPSDDSQAFIPFDALESSKGEKATVMLQTLLWDPNLQERRTYPLAAMPMRLGPAVVEDQTLANAGRWEAYAV